MRKLGWKTFSSQCEVTTAMGRSAGVAILVRAHPDAWSGPRQQRDLVAHRLIHVYVRSKELGIMSLY
eukprot:2995958-Pyramimonas_sp.AAC.1